MRRTIMSLPLLGLLALTSCATTPTDPASVVEKIQQTAVAVCGFLPFAKTVADILAAGNPLVSSVDSVATAICNAVVADRSARARGLRRGRGAMVNGVVIHGRWQLR